jgi:hypothetical protein
VWHAAAKEGGLEALQMYGNLAKEAHLKADELKNKLFITEQVWKNHIDGSYRNEFRGITELCYRSTIKTR